MLGHGSMLNFKFRCSSSILNFVYVVVKIYCRSCFTDEAEYLGICKGI